MTTSPLSLADLAALLVAALGAGAPFELGAAPAGQFVPVIRLCGRGLV